LDTIIIAIDGATKDVYENVRKSERFEFEEVRENAEQFLALRRARGQTRPFVILSIIAMDITSPDLGLFRDYWEARGADQVFFKPYANWGSQYSEVIDDLGAVKPMTAQGSPRSHPCKLMWKSMVVAWDGKVVPCCFDYDTKMVMGDLTTQTIDEIWNGPAYVALRQAEIEGRNNSALCANCTSAPGHAANPIRARRLREGRVQLPKRDLAKQMAATAQSAASASSATAPQGTAISTAISLTRRWNPAPKTV
jgi:radical SAM protein with 4Fe4S-binding SPASM domain